MMSPEEKQHYRLMKTVEEIVQTEKEYINDLDVIIRVTLLLTYPNIVLTLTPYPPFPNFSI